MNENENLDAMIDSQAGAGAAEPPLTGSDAQSNGVIQMQARQRTRKRW